MGMECIICRRNKDKSKFSIEHIIPESLGNSKLVLNTVCKECNDKLGSRVDSELVNLELFSYPRIKLDLKGKTGKLPKMFKRARLEDGRPVFVKYNKLTNKLDLKSPTIIDSEKVGDKFKYEIKSSSVEDAIKILKKSYERNTGKMLLKEEEEKYKKEFERNMTIEKPLIKNEYILDLLKIDLAFLKIAYELIFYLKLLNKSESEYLNDNRLKDLAKMISHYIYRDEEPNETLVVNKIKDGGIKDGLRHLSKTFFNHEFFHSITISALKDERVIKYNINLLNSFDRYIIIDDIDCKNFHKTIFVDPESDNILIGV